MIRLCICEVERIQCARCSFLLTAGHSLDSLDQLLSDLWVIRYQVVQSHPIEAWS